jgi:hypothetical protein
MKRILQLSFAAACLTLAVRATPTFSFDAAGGNLTGVAGGTVGWGFMISDPNEFVFISQTNFCPVSATVLSDVPVNCPLTAEYNSFAFNTPIIGPSPDSPTLTESFNPATSMGYGNFNIASNAPPGPIVGEIAIIYDLFTGDPNTDPNANQIGGDTLFTLDASITVINPSTPEPESMALMALGLAIAAAAGRRLKSGESPIGN